MIDAILVYNPKTELEILSSLAIEGDKVDWKPVIVLASSYLEKFGHERLKRYFEEKQAREKKKVKLSKKLEARALDSDITALEITGGRKFETRGLFLEVYIGDLDTPKYRFRVCLKEKYFSSFEEFLRKILPEKV